MNIYLRIYKLYQRQVPIEQISATTNIPTKMIKQMIAKFEAKGAGKQEEAVEEAIQPFLDYNINKHHKHLVVEYSGMLIPAFSDKVKQALREASQMPGQILAVKLENVFEVEKSIMKIILDFKERISTLGKTVVLLAPSDAVEEYIQANNVEKDTRVFGTQSAFEEYIFKSTFDKK